MMENSSILLLPDIPQKIDQDAIKFLSFFENMHGMYFIKQRNRVLNYNTTVIQRLPMLLLNSAHTGL
jgi:hypothetical protein